ncbi:MAG: RES family NAD+ phosphorylase [Chloroflexota bacterium]
MATDEPHGTDEPNGTDEPHATDEPIAEPPRIRIQGTWWRIARADSDPLFWSTEPADGRWQRGSVVRALYLGDSEATVWAEWYRHTSEAGVPPQQRLPRAIWRVDVDVADIADLTAPGILAGEGIARLDPTRRQWPKTQPIGEACWREGARGVLAPAAAREKGRVLAIFRPADGPTDSIEGVVAVPPPRRFTSLPPLPPGLRT